LIQIATDETHGIFVNAALLENAMKTQTSHSLKAMGIVRLCFKPDALSVCTVGDGTKRGGTTGGGWGVLYPIAKDAIFGKI
jgi:hypothetical protein